MHRKFLFAIPITIVFLLMATIVLAQGSDTLQAADQKGPNSVDATLGTAFNYQGSLTQGGKAANGAYEFEFRLYDAVVDGNQIGDPIAETLQVAEGLFAANLDFGASPWDGSAYYMQIAVRAQGSADPYTLLEPRQAVSAVPYALALPGLRTEQNGTSPNVIGGNASNSVAESIEGGVIAGGGSNYGPNSISADFGTVGGGRSNKASGNWATVGGGYKNTASGNGTTVSGGDFHTASGNGATVGGGTGNITSGDFATIGGGRHNVADDSVATVSGGYQNTAGNNSSTVAGGYQNTASGSASTVGGGYDNTASGGSATVGGGRSNTVSAAYGVIAGGGRSDPDDSATGNRVTDAYGTVSGGGNNQAGNANDELEDADFATVGGGKDNIANDYYATVGGGSRNTASGTGATVGGGNENMASDGEATVAGGDKNTASGNDATVGGGSRNTASGTGASVPGGWSNQADGDFSFAAGRRAKAIHDGAFVWADSTNADFASTGEDQFLIDADGGVGIGTSAPATQLHVVAARNGAANMTEHVVAIENNSTTSSNGPDVLALKVTNQSNPGGSTNYITFTDKDGGVGAVEGNGSGGVVYKTGGADFAEYLPQADSSETLAPGAVVGLAGGRVSLHTVGAEQVFVISTSPGFVGNAVWDEQVEDTALVALVGQTEVQVRGKAHAGDAIIASGLNDGVGVAVPVADLNAAQVGQVVGQALESGEDGSVLVLVGLPRDAIWQSLLQARDEQLAEVEERLTQLEQLVRTGDGQ